VKWKHLNILKEDDDLIANDITFNIGSFVAEVIYFLKHHRYAKEKNCIPEDHYIHVTLGPRYGLADEELPQFSR
jgi:hypothetical protein